MMNEYNLDMTAEGWISGVIAYLHVIRRRISAACSAARNKLSEAYIIRTRIMKRERIMNLTVIRR